MVFALGLIGEAASRSDPPDGDGVTVSYEQIGRLIAAANAGGDGAR